MPSDHGLDPGKKQTKAIGSKDQGGGAPSRNPARSGRDSVGERRKTDYELTTRWFEAGDGAEQGWHRRASSAASGGACHWSVRFSETAARSGQCVTRATSGDLRGGIGVAARW
jgi:hypothetical protein